MSNHSDPEGAKAITGKDAKVRSEQLKPHGCVHVHIECKQLHLQSLKHTASHLLKDC